MPSYFPLRIKKIFYGLSVLSAFVINAQELPPFSNFSPNEYGAENQNWGIDQSTGRLLYVANNKGLLEYNGASWRLFPSPNETIVRSVHVVNDRIYTGCYREFGFWTKNKMGTLDYTSLSKEIQDQLLEDEEFWSITFVEGKVFFQSKKRIYSYDLNSRDIDYLPTETSLPRIFNTDSGIFVHSKNQGLFKISGGQKILIALDKVLRNDEIINVFSRKGELLVVTQDQGFYKITNGVLEKWNIAADRLLEESSIYSALRLKDGRYALGMVSNGLLILSQDGKIDLTIDQINGLRNNTVLSIHEDLDGDLWLGLDNGISNINLTSPYRVYNEGNRIIGSVYAVEKMGEKLYLGTNQGLYVQQKNKSNDFDLIAGTEGQVWSLNRIGDDLFCGHHSGTFLISGTQAEKIADIPGTWKVGKLVQNKDWLVQGNYDGLYLLQNQNGKWNLRNKIEGFNNSSRYFEVLDHTIFVNHEYKGVFEIQVDNGFTRALKVKLNALAPGFNSSIAKFNNELFYAHKMGVQRYDMGKAQFVPDSTLNQIYSEDSYVSGKMVVDNLDAKLWFFTKDFLSGVYRGKLNETFVFDNLNLDKDVRESIDGYECIYSLEDKKYLLGTNSGYIVLNLTNRTNEAFEVYLEAINQLSKTQSGQLESYVALEENQQFASNENNLRFSFYTPLYDKFNIPKFQFQLSGIYPNWSEWSEESSVTFENLPYGDYTFKVRSKVGETLSKNVGSYSFTIAKPWYWSNMAIGLYIVTFILGALMIHTAYRKYYKNKQRKLIAKNHREMQLAKAQNEKEIIKIKNEQLQKEFKSKSNELAASTLSIIRKNELLAKVKEELISNEESKEFAKPIVDIIDKNLKKNDDWELFKKAFNNADRKFLKKLKKAHPQLTPNDIRLCAYLRLNLSSKEIAPLLNISPRSVEIKRYRLRKKMNLSHDENLVDYILKL